MKANLTVVATLAALVAGIGMAGLAGCRPGGPVLCTTDTPDCIARRQSHYAALTADTTYAWTARRPNAQLYASGVRLFAYRSSQSDMPCQSLTDGINETAAARQVLTPSATRGIAVDRVNQIIALAEDVNAELRATRRSRCGGTG